MTVIRALAGLGGFVAGLLAPPVLLLGLFLAAEAPERITPTGPWVSGAAASRLGAVRITFHGRDARLDLRCRGTCDDFSPGEVWNLQRVRILNADDRCLNCGLPGPAEGTTGDE